MTRHMDMLGLIIFCSILKASGQKIIHVFSSDAENATLPCYNASADCTSTTWAYYSKRGSPGIELFSNGKIHDRLSLGSDCSLNIYKTTTKDLGVYTCWLGVKDTQKTFGNVYLHVLQVSPSSSQTQIKPGRSVTLFYHCSISLTKTLLDEDDNTEWRCQITKGSEVKTSVSYTVSYLGGIEIVGRGLLVRGIIIIIEMAALSFPTAILLWICKTRAGKRRHPENVEI
ncbi:diverse immunoglobulin domain-containing protein 2.1 isoform X3 [Danio rerio]|uniref:diverse immunoglobulin domain-containing protein 2.1 isoform X3 n=1 Tax=Danio rerio TaxID=7955 RepID=UPI003CE4B3DA